MEHIKTEEKNRIIYLDLLRIFAIISVVLFHVIKHNWNVLDVNSNDWFIYNIFYPILKWNVPIFVMISGALFLNKKQDIKILYKKNILRILSIFIIWSLIYAIYTFINDGNLNEAVQTFFKGYYHLWFLYLIIGLYILVPILRKIIENENITKYFLILSGIFTFIVPMIITVIKIISINAGETAQSIVDNLNINMFIGYTFYFVLGYYLNNIKINKKTIRYVSIVGIIIFYL